MGSVRAKDARCIGIALIAQNHAEKPTVSGKRPKAGKNDRQGVKGRFVLLPHAVLDSLAYRTLMPRAVKLLIDIAYQYNGHNNGDLTAAWGFMRNRGWSSRDTLARAISDLIGAGLVIRTRDGMFQNPHSKCALYAITWQSIDECAGKDLVIGPTNTAPRKFSVERSKTPCPENGLSSHQKSGRARARDERGRYVSVQK